LLRNNDQEYKNPLASFATCLCWQRQRTVGGSRSQLCPRTSVF